MNSPAHYADRLDRAVRDKRTPAVVGIDPVLERLPPEFSAGALAARDAAATIEAFSREVIELVAPLVPCVKINSAFFEAYYEFGVAAYYRLIERAHALGLLVIGDVKRGDIGSTSAAYARGHLASPSAADVAPERMPDAVTLSGYLGAVQPFVDVAAQTGRGVYVLVRPSDPLADEISEFGSGGDRFYQHMARLVDRWGAQAGVGRCGLSLVGAVVAPKDVGSAAELRSALPRTPFLVPGYGAQGGALESCGACFLPNGAGAVVNASRSVIYSFRDPPRQARFGPDWRGAVREACLEFCDAMGRLVGLRK